VGILSLAGTVFSSGNCKVSGPKYLICVYLHHISYLYHMYHCRYHISYIIFIFYPSWIQIFWKAFFKVLSSSMILSSSLMLASFLSIYSSWDGNFYHISGGTMQRCWDLPTDVILGGENLLRWGYDLVLGTKTRSQL